MLFCAISGTAPEDPVISTKTGHLFERRLILKLIKENGKCPVTGDPLSEDDLLELKTNKAVKPRPSPATSIPGLLGLFHNEWDAMTLEMHTLRQQLHTTRQELSHALYQNDAACRVIARLLRELDESREALQQVQHAVPAELANGKRALDEVKEVSAKRPKPGLTPEVVEVLSQTHAELSASRKKRAISETLATPEEVASLVLLATQPLHKTTQGGILAIDVCRPDDNVVATGGADGSVVLYQRKQGRILASLEGHSKKVTGVKFLGDQRVVVSTSADKTVRLWKADEDGHYKCEKVFSDAAGEVTSVTVHPSNKYFITASADKTWCFYDESLCLFQVADPAVEAGYTCAEIHPDGIIMGTGTDEKLVRIWDVRKKQNAAKFEGHSGPVTSLSFSENGYYLATSASDGVKLWDLRKLKNFRALTPFEGSVTSSVSFDHSGLFLACGGPSVQIYGVKQEWSVVKHFQDVPKKGVHAVKFGADAKVLYIGASDHNLRILGLPDAA